MKRCNKCGKDLPLDAFTRRSEVASGYRNQCKECEAVRTREKYRRTTQILMGKATPPRPPAPSAPPEPQEHPLQTAERYRREAVARRDLKAEHRAQAEEIDALRATLEALGPLQAVGSVQPFTPSRDAKSDAVACLVLSDCHVEETVEFDRVNGLNEYNPTIAEWRTANAFRNGLTLAMGAARDSKIGVLYLQLLGDFFSGYLHPELEQENAMAPGDAAAFAMRLITSGIKYLLKESPFKVVIDALPGNHGRMTRFQQFANATGTSLETFMYRAVAEQFRDDPRVEFHIAQSGEVYRKFFERFTQRLIHGYQIRYGGGVGGITIPVNKWIANANTSIPATLTTMGHFHQLFNGKTFWVNGSLIGWNNYAQSSGFKFEAPCQSFYLIHAQEGGSLALNAPVWVKDKRERRYSA